MTARTGRLAVLQRASLHWDSCCSNSKHAGKLSPSSWGLRPQRLNLPSSAISPRCSYQNKGWQRRKDQTHKTNRSPSIQEPPLWLLITLSCDIRSQIVQRYLTMNIRLTKANDDTPLWLIRSKSVATSWAPAWTKTTGSYENSILEVFTIRHHSWRMAQTKLRNSLAR